MQTNFVVNLEVCMECIVLELYLIFMKFSQFMLLTAHKLRKGVEARLHSWKRRVTSWLPASKLFDGLFKQILFTLIQRSIDVYLSQWLTHRQWSTMSHIPSSNIWQ